MTEQIKNMSPKVINEVTSDIFKALKDIEKKYGIEISQKGNIGYSDLNFKLALNVSVLNEDNLDAQAEKDYLTYVKMYGLNTNGFRKPFMKNGTKYQVVGVSFRAKKYPFLVERIEDGARFKFTSSSYEVAFPLTK